MDWARDQLGALVHAAQRGLFSYGLRCPTCGEPVRRRAGLERRPHFAHYSHSAKPECEYYHPLTGAVVRVAAQPRDEQQATSSSRSLQGGLFLEERESRYSLYLKLPRLAAEASGGGELRIWAGLGERTYTAVQLQRTHMMPVIPQLPLVKVSASGVLIRAAEAIKMDVSLFKSTGNYFQLSEVGGRLLAPLEPLEWGERYLLLTQGAYAPAPVDFGMMIESREWTRGWIIHRIQLPTVAKIGDESTRETISRYLGRTIKAPRARVYFVDPPPHHFEPDGTFVFPETTKRIVLRQTEGGRVSIEASEQTLRAVGVRHLEDEWCEVTGIGTGDFTVLLDGREELLGRVEKCDLFRPEGVRVVVGERAWEIFEPDLRDAVQHRSQETVRIECPRIQVAEQLALEKDAWTRVGKTFVLLKPVREAAIDGDNFGALTWLPIDTPAFEPRSIDPQILARRLWIEGLVARAYCQDMHVRLRDTWSGPNSGNPSAVAEGDLAWLQPHIHFARST